MVNGIHCHSANRGSPSEPAISTRFSQRDNFMFEITHLANSRVTILEDQPDFTRGEFDVGIFSFLRHQLASPSCTPDDLTALSHLQLDIVNQCAGRDISKG